ALALYPELYRYRLRRPECAALWTSTRFLRCRNLSPPSSGRDRAIGYRWCSVGGRASEIVGQRDGDLAAVAEAERDRGPGGSVALAFARRRIAGAHRAAIDADYLVARMKAGVLRGAAGRHVQQD